MQDDLFGDTLPTPPPAEAAASAPASRIVPGTGAPTRRSRSGTVAPIAPDGALTDLAAALPPRLRLGTSSWAYPGWKGLVWEGEHSDTQLSKQGLAVYTQNPLMRTVSIYRSFYRPLTVSQYERYASQVPDDFRFVVKAPSVVTDALVRS